MSKGHLAIAFLIGAFVAVAAQAHPVENKADTSYYAVIGNSDSTRGQRETLFVIDSKNNKLAVYTWTPGASTLDLGAVRDLSSDLQFVEWSPAKNLQRPSVKEMRKEIEKQQKEKEKENSNPPR